MTGFSNMDTAANLVSGGPGGAAEAKVAFTSSQGIRFQASALRMTREAAGFELYALGVALQASEVLSEFRIVLDGRTLYSGKAVVCGLVHAGAVTVCEVALEDGWVDVELQSLGPRAPQLQASFGHFLGRWEKFYKILPECKLVVSDMQSFLLDLRLWLEQVELGVRAMPSGDRLQAERETVRGLMNATNPAISEFFERFEEVTGRIALDLVPIHRSFCRRHLHPLLLASPFMHRIYTKPLGYAGDYEMVNMIMRDPMEGGSLFAKLLNVFILSQVPAEAHRNRVLYLKGKLIEETSRRLRDGEACRIFDLGCGPAREVQDFLTEQPLANSAEFTLLDMNDETLQHAGRVLEAAKMRSRRQTPIKLVKKTVHHLLKQAGKPRSPGEEYDFIYCAGLFDYLSDRVCHTLINLCYDWLAPGGLLLVTNVDPRNPIRNAMEYFYEWHLIYRTGNQLAALASEVARLADVKVLAEPTSSNLFLEIRKPVASP